MSENSYYIEIRKLGNSIKVTAIDPLTGIEAVVVAPTNLSRRQLSDLAVKKLEYIMKNKSSS